MVGGLPGRATSRDAWQGWTRAKLSPADARQAPLSPSLGCWRRGSTSRGRSATRELPGARNSRLSPPTKPSTNGRRTRRKATRRTFLPRWKSRHRRPVRARNGTVAGRRGPWHCRIAIPSGVRLLHQMWFEAGSEARPPDSRGRSRQLSCSTLRRWLDLERR